MRKLGNIVVFILLVATLWYFYGDAFERSGFQGVYDEIRSDINHIKEDPRVEATFDTIEQEIKLLFGKVKENFDEEEQPSQPDPEKPELDAPQEQTFSIHNIEIGNDRSTVEQEAGEPKRSSLNSYGVDWVTYHENYHNFFMAAYDENNQVVGLYTNQDLISSKYGITMDSSRDDVLANMDEPLKALRKGFINYQIQSNQEYDMFLVDNNYVTVFYDKHEESTVTAIKIVTGDLEKDKQNYFASPSEELKEGFEYQLFDLTNAARVVHGLSVLTWDEAVRVTARDHSKDMADNNYFSHTNLQGQSPFDRMEEDGIDFMMAGENLAAGQASSIFAHEGLMNSLGHRENILKSDYEALGIGVAFNEESQPYFTENFLSK